MLERRQLFAIAIGLVLLPGVTATQEAAAPVTSNVVPAIGGTAAEQMLVRGPEAEALALRAGLWEMTQTSWSSPNAAPVTITGLVAERQMIGPFLEEVVHAGPDSSAPPFKRLDYLTFNRVEGRWDYASMDTRSSNGIMPAWSVGRDPAARIDLVFQPFAIAGSGSEVRGQMLRMEQIITNEGPDRDVKDQYFTLADGVGTRWLAKRYTYTRRPSCLSCLAITCGSERGLKLDPLSCCIAMLRNKARVRLRRAPSARSVRVAEIAERLDAHASGER